MRTLDTKDGYKPSRPDNHLVLALICTFLCCMPLGIVSIVYSAKVNSAYDDGDYVRAENNSRNAKVWAIVGMVIGALTSVIGWILYIVLYAGAAILSGNQ